MADTKISALTAIVGSDVDTTADVLVIVDTSITTTKKILVDELAKALSSETAASALAASASAGTGTLLSKVDHAHQRQLESIIIAVGDETTAITTGTAKVTFRIPYAFTATAIRASLTTVGSTGTTVDVNLTGTGTIMATDKLNFDASEKTTVTYSGSAAALSTTAFADDDELTIDIDTAGTSAAGLKVCIIGRQSA